MTKTYRELTGKEKRQIKKLVVSKCANYDKEYGCLPLDCECYSSGYATHAVDCAVIFARLYCRKIRNCKPYSSRCPLPSARSAESIFKRTANVPTVPTSAPQKQDASKRRQECESTENKSGNKTLCNELASEMP